MKYNIQSKISISHIDLTPLFEDLRPITDLTCDTKNNTKERAIKIIIPARSKRGSLGKPLVGDLTPDARNNTIKGAIKIIIPARSQRGSSGTPLLFSFLNELLISDIC